MTFKHSQPNILWLGIAIIAVWRMAVFWGLAHGNADDMTTDYVEMTLGWKAMAISFAKSQARIYNLVSVPAYAIMMRLAGTVWYSVFNLSTFALGGLLPIFALRRYLNLEIVQLFSVVYFATLPLLFSYTPPYAYPAYMFLPLALGGLALLMLDEWHVRRIKWFLIAGCVLLFFALCGYEPIALLLAAYLGFWFWSSHAGKPKRDIPRRIDFWCCCAVFVAYWGAYLAFRVTFPSTYAGVQPAANLTIPLILKVVGTLSLTSSIFAWYHFTQLVASVDIPSSYQAVSVIGAPGFQEMIREMTLPDLLGGVLTFCLSVWLTFRMLRQRTGQLFALALLAGLLLFVPNLPYGFVPKISRLVLANQLYAYTATTFSQTGFALLFVSLIACAGWLRQQWLKSVVAVAVSLVVSWGWLAASGFNRTSAVFARVQEAKWTAVNELGECRSFIPPAYLNTIVAPRLWNASTARLSWGQVVQDRRYWDLYSRSHLGVNAGFVKVAPARDAPITSFDYRLRPDGALDGVIFARSSDGMRFQEMFIIRDRRAAIPAGVMDRKSTWKGQLPGNTFSCGGNLEVVHLAGVDLDVASAQIHGLPPWDPVSR